MGLSFHDEKVEKEVLLTYYFDKSKWDYSPSGQIKVLEYIKSRDFLELASTLAIRLLLQNLAISSCTVNS